MLNPNCESFRKLTFSVVYDDLFRLYEFVRRALQAFFGINQSAVRQSEVSFEGGLGHQRRENQMSIKVIVDGLFFLFIDEVRALLSVALNPLQVVLVLVLEDVH